MLKSLQIQPTQAYNIKNKSPKSLSEERKISWKTLGPPDVFIWQTGII